MPQAIRLAIPFAVALTAACAGAPAKRAEVRWPAAPDPARIRFVRSISTGADVETSGFQAFQRSLLGTRPVSFQQPSALALTPDGQRLYVTDQTLGQVLWFDFKLGEAKAFAPATGFSQPMGVALDGAGNVYVSEPPRRRVRVFSPEGQILREFGGEAERPTGLAVDARRQLVYLADSSFQASQNHRILVYSQQGKLLRTIGARGSAPGQFNFPAYLALDPQGNLYVSDVLNFRIQVFDPEGNLIRFFGEAGETIGTFARPKGVAVDRRGITYVVDTDNASVQLFDDKNRLLMYFGGRADLLEYFSQPGPIAIDQAGRLIYVGDQSVNFPRINVYEFLEAAEPAR